MCGIAGLFVAAGGVVDRAALAAMNRSLAHRGPDGSGDWVDEGAGIGLTHRRLAIIDLTPASAQPMVDSLTGSVLIYNGELYNFRELRRELEGEGFVFTTVGDVEVMLRALVAWGDRALERFAGMFALAFWDAPRRRLLLARDALGMKPLYWTRLPGGRGIAFASEVKAFLELPGFLAALRPDGLRQYLEFGYVWDESDTILLGVQKLPPGRALELVGGEPERSFSHFELPFPDSADRRSLDERAAELLAVLGEVVDQHLIADVPIGLLLSGGLDSSFIGALARRRGPLRSIAMGFARSRLDERAEARRAAEAIGSDHEEILLEPEEVAAEVEGAAFVFDDLFGDWGTISTRVLYRRCRERGVKVALVGEGSDELFAGYTQFPRTNAPRRTRITFRRYQAYASRRWGGLYGRFRRTLEEIAPGADLFESIRRFETRRQLPNNFVMKVDKASMSVSLEARAPYLDRRVARLALSTPAHLLQAGGENKLLLRRAAELSGLLPREIARRPKVGGSMPASWLDEVPSFREFARSTVLDGSFCRILGLRRPMERYFAHGRIGDPWPMPLAHHGVVAWRLLLLELWARSYLPKGKA
jgi:asparagine synthase (glutamine-hydrolysing)